MYSKPAARAPLFFLLPNNVCSTARLAARPHALRPWRGSGCLDASHEVSRGVCRATVGQGVWYKEGGMPPAGKDVEPASQGQERGDRRA